MIVNLNKIPPEVVINSILYAAHQEYSAKRKKVVLTKAVKLIVRSIEEINYKPISYGCFKHGEYSFQVHSITKPIFVTRSLHGADINKELVDFDIVELVKPVVIFLKPIMTGTWKKFLKYAHGDRISPEYQELYKWHDAFHDILAKAADCKKEEIGKYYEIISYTISNFDSTLTHVDKKYLPFYFDFMDLLEGVLMVCRNRSTNFFHVKEVLSDFNDIYEMEISTFLFPFTLTLKGENIDYEKNAYATNTERKLANLQSKFNDLKGKVKKYNLIPSVEDFDLEIEKSLNEISPSEKKDILDLLTT